jgi:protein-L-isoaspartate(D-aspartate) O-methyltransferase
MVSDIDPFLQQRRNMVGVQLRRRSIRDERVLAAMERVPRHEFIAREFWSRAHNDDPVPIGEGQTVSQPYIVAAMLQGLEIAPEHRVLEVGTGTGYQAALLAELAREVFTIERHAVLAEAARQNLVRLGYCNATVITCDGTQGWPSAAPYDRIIVAAAAPSIPPSLFGQLLERGKMIVPVGSTEMQELLLVQKAAGQPLTSALEGCRFVPLIGAEGFADNLDQARRLHPNHDSFSRDE